MAAFDFPTSPTIGDIYTLNGVSYSWTGVVWRIVASGTSVSINPTPPVSPAPGDLWWNSTTGDLSIYYNDGSSSQWVGVAGTGALTRIAQVVTSGAQTTIDFSSIPQLFASLRLVFVGRDASTGSADLSAFLKVNNDGTAANYTSSIYVLGNGSGAAGSSIAATTNGVNAVWCPGTSGNAQAIGSGDILLPNYAGTVFHKPIQGLSHQSANAATLTGIRGAVWKSTAAINRLTLTAPTAFVDGTTATLYGMG